MTVAAQPTRALLGQSRAMQDLRYRILQIAPTTESVLITGECGTGKDLVARELHAASGRRAQALVRFNCGVYASDALERELLGQEFGLTAGPRQPSIGRLERADRGTLLVDDVTELPLSLQAKLRRVLDEGCFERSGGTNSVSVDVRLIALSHRSPADEMAAGRLSRELYFRLAVVPIAIPPLRERREDLGELFDYLLRESAARLHCQPSHFSPAAMELLEAYDWPGNVRELENMAVRANVLHAGQVVDDKLVRGWLEVAPPRPHVTQDPPSAESYSLREVERLHIESTLERCGGHRGRTAEALGIGTRTLSAKLKEYGQTCKASAVPPAHVHF